MALGKGDLKRVRKLLYKIRDKWYDIGVELDMDPDILDEIEKDNPDPKDCLTKMIKEWLKSSPPWSALGDALKDEIIDEVDLAEKAYAEERNQPSSQNSTMELDESSSSLSSLQATSPASNSYTQQELSLQDSYSTTSPKADVLNPLATEQGLGAQATSPASQRDFFNPSTTSSPLAVDRDLTAQATSPDPLSYTQQDLSFQDSYSVTSPQADVCSNPVATGADLAALAVSPAATPDQDASMQQDSESATTTQQNTCSNQLLDLSAQANSPAQLSATQDIDMDASLQETSMEQDETSVQEESSVSAQEGVMSTLLDSQQQSVMPQATDVHPDGDKNDKHPSLPSPPIVIDNASSDTQNATHFAVPISVPLRPTSTGSNPSVNPPPLQLPQESSGMFQDGGASESLPMELGDLPNPDVQSVVRDFSIELKEGHKVRGYQKELAQPGIEGKNYIMVAQTGSGKTLAAALVISDHLNKFQLQSPCHVAFVTETKPLADQQKTALDNLIPQAVVEVYTGDTFTKVANSIRLNNNISVCTAGKLLEEIKARNVTFDQLSLIVFDECHHTKKGHPFSKLMEMYLQYRDDPERNGRLPQVIGMTASPGAGDNPDLDRTKTIDHLLLLAARMDATGGFKTVTENIDELQECAKSSEFNSNFLNPRDVKNDHFLHVVSAEMDRLEKLISNNLMKNNFQKWSQEYETKVQQVKSSLELTGDSQARDDISTLILLRCYSNALSFYVDMEQKDALKVMKEQHDLPSDYSKYTPREKDLKHGLDSVLREADSIVPKRNPLLKNMEDILLDTFESNLASRGIVFVRTKRHAHAMLEWVLENKAFKGMLKPDVITGHTRDSGHGMTQVTQEEVMSSFHAGKTNLLIATSVAEEGLDIPECNLMIRYQHVTNEIARVQTQGRARAENSRGYLLVSSSKKKYQEFKNQELNMLVDEILEKKWFPTGGHLSEKLVELQRSIINAKKLKSRLRREKMLTHRSREVRLLCKKCKAFGCYGSDIYTIADESNTAFHYVVPSEEFSKRYFTKIHHTPADLVRDKVRKTHKIHCSNCEFDWGVKCIWPTEGHSFPVIKCKGFIFETGKHLRTLKKWKEAPFKMDSLSTWLSDNESSSDEN